MNLRLRSSPSGKLYDLATGIVPAGEQTAWAIDPATGDDDNPGTPLYPLRTMTEFNGRLTGVVLSVVATLSLIGNVLDESMMLTGLRMKGTASLTVSGTRTQVGSGNIATVTAIGVGGTTFPWQLATTGIDWTTAPVGAQIQLQGGQIAWVRNVVDANTIVIGATSTLTSNTMFTPTAGLSFTVSTLSRILPPMVQGLVPVTGSTITPVVFNHVSIDNGTNISFSGIPVAFAGCESKVGACESPSSSTFLFRSCRISMPPAGMSIRSASGRFTIAGGVIVPTSTVNPSLTTSGSSDDLFFLSATFYQALFLAFGGHTTISTGGMHFEAAGSGRAFQVDNDGYVFCSGIVNGRNCTATVGIEVVTGALGWNGAAIKPTLGIASGCTNDVRIGAGGTAIIYTYAALGTGKCTNFLDAVPPTTTALTLVGSAKMFQNG